MGSNKILDLTGQRFGRLTVIKPAGRNTSNKIQWICMCDCGNEVIVTTCHLRSGHTTSCGCYRYEMSIKANIVHNGTGTRLYNIWCDIKKRCNNSRSRYYKHYGGRGIKVCEEWKHDFQTFYDWAMTNGYKDDLTIDRQNVDGDYEPSNCRWVNREEQQNNKRNNHVIAIDGLSMNIAQWARYLKIPRSRIDSAYKRKRNLEEYIKMQLQRKAAN